MAKSFRRQSYNALPALSVRGPALRSSLQLVTAGWTVGLFWAAFIGGSGWEILAAMMGFKGFSLGLLQATPHIATVFLLLASVSIERTGLTKYQFIFFGTIHRALWVVVAGVPLVLAIPSSTVVCVVTGILLLSYCTEAMSRPAWYTWMGALIPSRIHGRYWSRRTQITAAVGAVAGLSIGWTIKQLQPPAGIIPSAQEHPHLLNGLMALMAICSILGVVDILIFRRIPEVLVSKTADPAVDAATGKSRHKSTLEMFRWMLIQPMRASEFRRFVLADALMASALASSGLFAFRNMRVNLGLDALEIQLLFSLVSPIAAIASARYIGRAIDRWGPRPVMKVASFATTMGIIPFLILYPGMPGLWLVCIGTFIAGAISWGAYMMGKASVQLRFSKREGASRYVSAFSFYVGVGGMLGALAAGWLTHFFEPLQDNPIRLGPLLWNNWHAAFALSLLARIGGAMVLRGGRTKD
jgi:hypothetical protein